MIVADVNLPLYAEIDAHRLHARARRWWEDALSGDRQVGLAPVCLFGFLRIATNRRVFTEPLAVDDAIGRVAGWQPHDRRSDRRARVEVNGEVYSNDGDFNRFEGVRCVNPLET